MAFKKLKKIKKKEDLPSFLLKSPEVPENVSFPPKTTKSVHHLGPLFFGCHEYQPMIHRLNLVHTHELHKTASSTENILRDAFLTESPIEIYKEEKKVIPHPGKRQADFFDPYPHKCPGVRRIFVPEPAPAPDFGQTESTIEGEASREIPLYCFRQCPDGGFDDCEVVELSDIWEKRRPFMALEERRAHPHFPKHFVNVQIIGPPIPASIAITKLPSKRRTESQLDLEITINADSKKGTKGDSVKTEKATEQKGEEKEESSGPEFVPLSEQEIVETIKFDADDEKGGESNEETGSQEHHSEHDVAQTNEEAADKEEGETKDEEGVTNAVVNDGTAEEEAPAEEEPGD